MAELHLPCEAASPVMLQNSLCCIIPFYLRFWSILGAKVPTRQGIIQELLVLKNLLCTAAPADPHSSSCRPAICLGLLLVRCSSYSLRCLYSSSCSQAFIHSRYPPLHHAVIMHRRTPSCKDFPTPTKQRVSVLPKFQLRYYNLLQGSQ